MKLTKSQINEVIDELQRTCLNLDDVIERMFGVSFMDIAIESLEAIDGEIFECTQCCWWYEISEKDELNGEPVCKDCMYYMDEDKID